MSDSLQALGKLNALADKVGMTLPDLVRKIQEVGLADVDMSQFEQFFSQSQHPRSVSEENVAFVPEERAVQPGSAGAQDRTNQQDMHTSVSLQAQPTVNGAASLRNVATPAKTRSGQSAPGNAALQSRASEKKTDPAERMNKMFAERYILVDISSFLEPFTGQFLEHALPLLRRYGKQLCIPYSALAQMREWAEKSPDKDLRLRCAKRLRGLRELQKQNVLEVRKKAGADSPAQEMLTLCAFFRMTMPLLVITQDKALARDLLKLNEQQSANGRIIQVKRINDQGYLSNVIESGIRIYSEPRTGTDTELPVTILPKENDTVYIPSQSGSPIRLMEPLGSGGEGTIYRTNTPYVAKIYKPECCTAYRKEKIQTMLDAELNAPGICFPKAILNNEHNEFVGYLMEEAKGVTIRKSIFAPRYAFQEQFPDWKKRDLVQCALTILRKIQYLHEKNILIGDINPHNFLVVSPTEIYLVDTDSFQINDLPCPVGFPDYTAPEIHQRHRDGGFQHYSELMRTEKNEDFAVATLLFMILMPGKRPYAHQGGSDIVDNILEMRLPYSLGKDVRAKDPPLGPWRFIWSHFPRRIREAFHRVFNKTQDSSAFNERERLPVAEWVAEMYAYLKILDKWEKELQENPKSTEADPQSLILFPNRFRHKPGVKYAPCRNCGMDSPEDDMKAGFCYTCQKLGSQAVCSLCGNTFTFTNYDKYYLKVNEKGPLFCEECRERGEERTCLNCEAPFVFTNFDRYYKFARFPKPPRYNGLLCKECTKRNKEIKYRADCEICKGKDKVEVSIGYNAYLMSKGYRRPKSCSECRKKRLELGGRDVSSVSDVSASIPEFDVDWGREAWDD